MLTMTLFDLPIWLELLPYAHVTFHTREKSHAAKIIRLDFLHLPNPLRARALQTEAGCVSCGALINPLRARRLSDRSRIAGTETEHRLFYGPTCLIEIRIGCARTREIKSHKEWMTQQPWAKANRCNVCQGFGFFVGTRQPIHNQPGARPCPACKGMGKR